MHAYIGPGPRVWIVATRENNTSVCHVKFWKGDHSFSLSESVTRTRMILA